MDEDLRLIRAVAEYQFGPGAGLALFPDKLYSPLFGPIMASSPSL
jgi:archaeosine-15-forming tRNA-guanine transglycosylase